MSHVTLETTTVNVTDAESRLISGIKAITCPAFNRFEECYEYCIFKEMNSDTYLRSYCMTDINSFLVPVSEKVSWVEKSRVTEKRPCHLCHCSQLTLTQARLQGTGQKSCVLCRALAKAVYCVRKQTPLALHFHTRITLSTCLLSCHAIQCTAVFTAVQ